MESDAFKLGSLDAAIDFGLTKEAYAKALSTLAGGLVGGMMAPEGETAQGAALGAAGAWGLHSAGQAAMNHFKGAPAPHGAPGGTQMAQSVKLPGAAGALNDMHRQEDFFAKTRANDRREMDHTNSEIARNRASMGPHPLPPAPSIDPATAAASKHFGTDPAMVTAMMNAPGANKGAPQRHAPGPQMDADLQALHGPMTAPPPPPPPTVAQGMDADLAAANAPAPMGTPTWNAPQQAAPPAAPTAKSPAKKPAAKKPTEKKPAEKKPAGKTPAEEGRESTASLERFKIAVDISGSAGIPGIAGVSLGLKDQRERLPGMDRWVPRSTMERGFEYADSGLDDDAVAGLESSKGNVLHPLLGAALAAAGARKFMPSSGAMGPLLAGLVGGGLGTLYNQATQEQRAGEGVEALHGAQRERKKFPIQRHKTQTANESSPMAVSRGSGDA